MAVGGSPPREHALGFAVTASIVVTIGSFFVVQPVLDVAAKAVASLGL